MFKAELLILLYAGKTESSVPVPFAMRLNRGSKGFGIKDAKSVINVKRRLRYLLSVDSRTNNWKKGGMSMAPNVLRTSIAFMMMAAAVFVFANTAVAAETNVVGVITEDGAIETAAGEYIEVADTYEGNEMLEHVGQTVEAIGEITEVDGVRTLSVSSYTIIE
jgi:hypothetical protein